MENCKLCIEFDNCSWRYDPDVICSEFKRKPMTNGDRIRSMTDEELFFEFCNIYNRLPDYSSSWTWLREWLNEEAE